MNLARYLSVVWVFWVLEELAVNFWVGDRSLEMALIFRDLVGESTPKLLGG
jgi:hypothetical protein